MRATSRTVREPHHRLGSRLRLIVSAVKPAVAGCPSKKLPDHPLLPHAVVGVLGLAGGGGFRDASLHQRTRVLRSDTMNTPAEALALSHIGYAEAQVVARFIDEKLRAAVDERTPTGLHGIAFQGQLLRTIAWLRSLAKLDDPGNDFQAITSAARSVFESAVDVTLMHFDGSANGPEKMDAWEDSAKLKHSQNATEYLAASGRAPPTRSGR